MGITSGGGSGAGTPAYAHAAFFRITEQKRTGTGGYTNGTTNFMWTGPSRTAPQGTLDLELQNKTVRKEMPGSNHVVEQTLSSTWQPFDLTGVWDDKWAGPGFAWGMYNDFAIFAQTIPLVKIELDKNSLIGLITGFKVKYKVESKIFWTMTISPHRNNSFTAQSTGTELDYTKKTVQQRVAELQSSLDSLQYITDSYRPFVPIKTGFSLNFQKQLDLISGAISAINLLGVNLQTVNTEDNQQKLATLFGTIRSTSLGAFFFFANDCDRNNVADNDELGALTFDSWIDQSRWQFWKLAGKAREGYLDMMRRIGVNNPLTIYYPKPNESLERISVKFYGTPNNADLIQSSNHLTYYVMKGTEKLIIPKSGSTTIQQKVLAANT